MHYLCHRSLDNIHFSRRESYICIHMPYMFEFRSPHDLAVISPSGRHSWLLGLPCQYLPSVCESSNYWNFSRRPSTEGAEDILKPSRQSCHLDWWRWEMLLSVLVE